MTQMHIVLHNFVYCKQPFPVYLYCVIFIHNILEHPLNYTRCTEKYNIRGRRMLGELGN